jgi:hypothetical protein
MADVRKVVLKPEEFEQLTFPLRRLKMSLVWQNILRERQVAESTYYSAVKQGLPIPKVSEAILNTPEAGSGIIHRGLSFELGSLNGKYASSERPRGEASIHFGFGWRVESPRAVVFESRDNRVEIDREIESFKGRRILDVQTVGRLPEIVVSLSKRRWIQSFSTHWNIHLPDRTWVVSQAGHLVRYYPFE